MKKLIPKAEQKLCYVKWQDSHSFNAWMTSGQLQNEVDKEMKIVEEVGWVVYEDDSEVHLIGSRAVWISSEGGEEYHLHRRIPKAWVLIMELIEGIGNVDPTQS